MRFWFIQQTTSVSYNRLLYTYLIPALDSRSFDLLLLSDMSSKLSSRSRGGAPVKANSKETGPKLEENLNIFKSDKFDADGFVNSKCNSLNEKVSIAQNASCAVLQF